MLSPSPLIAATLQRHNHSEVAAQPPTSHGAETSSAIAQLPGMGPGILRRLPHLGATKGKPGSRMGPLWAKNPRLEAPRCQ